MPRIVIFGNSGSGKSTEARRLAQQYSMPRLDLDHIAWSSPGVRKPIEQSAVEIEQFIAATPDWVAEGCYADLLAFLLPHATEVVFMNPGVDTCVANARARPWERDKYASPEEQDARLEFLIEWIRQYETRSDEYSLVRHRALFDRFAGPKREISELRR